MRYVVEIRQIDDTGLRSEPVAVRFVSMDDFDPDAILAAAAKGLAAC